MELDAFSDLDRPLRRRLVGRHRRGEDVFRLALGAQAEQRVVELCRAGEVGVGQDGVGVEGVGVRAALGADAQDAAGDRLCLLPLPRWRPVLLLAPPPQAASSPPPPTTSRPAPAPWSSLRRVTSELARDSMGLSPDIWLLPDFGHA